MMEGKGGQGEGGGNSSELPLNRAQPFKGRGTTPPFYGFTPPILGGTISYLRYLSTLR